MIRTAIPRTLFIVFMLLTTLVGCYRISIEQGNIITNRQIQKLAIGMKKQQVAAILGQPILRNVFDNNQLVYVYSLKSGLENTKTQRLLIYFRSNRIVKIKNDFNPLRAKLHSP